MVQTSKCMLIIQTVNFTRDLIRLIKVKLSQHEWHNLAAILMDRHLLTDLIENTEVRVVSALNKAVTKNCHLVHFEGVTSHNIKKLL